ncbi:MAG: glycosyltransferase family 4 protein [Hyphomicrobiaceae bacterium]|nr:glycosyltransferase family 4 protein [Hyphomicrobiaceae bacterium]
MSSPVAFVLKGYPRLSETFIAQEILALEQRGLNILIVSLRQPTDAKRHPVHDEIRADVLYLPEFPVREPRRVARAWWQMRRRPGYKAARRQWLADLCRDPSLVRFRSFLQALVLASERPADVDRFHAHYLHTPACVTRYAAITLGIPWTCSAHARDIWTTPEWEKREKLAELDWLVTCTDYGFRHLASLAPEPSRVELVYHGLDLSRFPQDKATRGGGDGSSDDQAVTILSVGRAVPKKGYESLLEAFAQLPEALHWRFVHIGFGDLLDALRRKAQELGIDDKVTWLGAQPQDKVIEAYRRADLFVLANRVAADGDMDGLPNVIMEAQSQGLPVLSTRISAIPEIIEDGVNGVLVQPDDSEALAQELERLIADPTLRARLGENGAARMRRDFSHERGVEQLVRKFGLADLPARMRA